MALKKASLEEIKAKYAEVFGQNTPASNNKIFLWRKIAYGGLSEEVEGRLNALIEK